MRYKHRIQIGISHIGKDGRLKLGAAMDLLQNATWFQINTEIAFMHYFAENHAGMYLISRQIDFLRFPAYGEHIAIDSWVNGCDRLYGYRNTALYDCNGTLCIASYAIGVFVDLEKAMPARIPQELLDKMKTYPPLDMELLPRKIPLSAAPQTEGEAIMVQGYHLDNYGHMNNARYVDIASACLPDDFPVRRMRAEYKRAAFPGDLIIPHCACSGDDAFTVTLSAGDGSVFTVIEFRGEPSQY
jgi:acyl-ACP thioesterase